VYCAMSFQVLLLILFILCNYIFVIEQVLHVVQYHFQLLLLILFILRNHISLIE